MKTRYWKEIILCFSLLFAIAVYLPVNAQTQDRDPGSMEETGLTDALTPGAPARTTTPLAAVGRDMVLLIPDSTADVVGMYDPFDGTYLGDLINGVSLFSTPINAILGPDGNIYVSDQVADSVFVFDSAGTYLSTYADPSDGLNNVRGIDFWNDHLFVTSGDDYVAEFDGPHSRLADFIADGSDPFDILFLPDGTSLLTDIQGTTDNVRHYDAGGVLIAELFKTTFPEQVQFDSLLPGAFLSASFSDKDVTDFEIDGTIVNITPSTDFLRGVFRLGNGNLLVTSSSGVQEIDPATGSVIQTENTGSARFIELVELTKNPLTSDNNTIVETVGGIVNFTLDAGTAYADRKYLLLGGVTGSSPGTPLPGGMVTLPVNWDLYTTIMLNFLNTTIFQNFLGKLDTNGQAAATFDTLGPIPGAAGITMTYAFALRGPYDFASNPVDIQIVP